MNDRPSCYPDPPSALSSGQDRMPLLDVFTSPVPSGLFQSPTDWRHVLCIHLGEPVPVSYGPAKRERPGTRIHGQFCVVPAGSSTRWIIAQPTRSLLLRLTPSLLEKTAEAMGVRSADADLVPSIHLRDSQIERIGWIMQAEEKEGYPGGRLFADSLATALATRLLSLQTRRTGPNTAARHALPAWQLRRLIEYIEAHLDQDLSLTELAGVSGYSLSHFKLLFRNATGVPVHRFVLERRVERARQHLIEGERSIAEIALEAGFAHSSHMARCVRQVLGVTPSQIAHRKRTQLVAD